MLDERAITRALLCFAMVPNEPAAPANEALAHYLRGLALIGKTNVHFQFDLNILQEFLLALRDGMRAFHDWDGKSKRSPSLTGQLTLEGIAERAAKIRSFMIVK